MPVLVVDEAPDIADRFSKRRARYRPCVMHFAASAGGIAGAGFEPLVIGLALLGFRPRHRLMALLQQRDDLVIAEL